MSADVTGNHFARDFFHLNEDFSCFEITAELSFQDGECGFNELTFSVFGIIGSVDHLLSIDTSDEFIVPGARRDN